MTKFFNYIKESQTISWSSYVGPNPELKAALSIMKEIEKLGYEALIVGGFVRI